ncbi:MAG: YegS/Rv2252/BmrU family lipid kinase [Bacteroidales bacterium]|nr:YegS/Rv2252/BmrU family lipid kinase [Bacteroidales bacterium]
MKKKKILFIINPISGTNRKRKKEKTLKYINKYIDTDKYHYKYIFTKAKNHAKSLSIEAAENGYDIIVAVGGDGTINEVSKTLINTDIILGIIPLGSGNGLARHLNIPLNLKKTIKIINKCKTKKIDTVIVNNDAFISIAGVGFDAYIAKKFEQNIHRGFKTYFNLILKKYINYEPKEYIIEIDGKRTVEKSLFITVANSNQFGYNAIIAPNAKLNDGLIDVCITKKPPVIKAIFISNLLFLRKIDKSKFIKIIQTKKIKIIRQQNNIINLDGEQILLSKELNIKVNPLSLNVIVP